MPLQKAHAALVPIEKTSLKSKRLSNKVKKKEFQRYKKNQQKKLQLKKKKQLYKPNRKNTTISTGFIALILGIIILYVGTSIVLMIVGAVLALPGLWITGICLLATPLIILIISMISDGIEAKKYSKEQKDKLQ
jgi:Flp pilus assembly protein TadB